MDLIQSETELDKVLEKITKEVIDEVTEKIMKRLQEILQEKIYDMDSGRYTRLKGSGGLYGAWKTKPSKLGKEIVGSMEYAPEKIIYNPEKSQHGWDVVGDIRDRFPELVELGMGYKWGGNAKFERPFWHYLIKDLDAGLLDKWIYEGFKNRMGGEGFSITKS